MPQLNPAPWYLTMLTIWTIIILIFTPLLMKIQLPNTTEPNKATISLTPWTWSWY
uniref:ATP synthase F0 subunit 8 n=1 Tax=Coleonyx mitratus TaxID=449391 RepID=UPI0025520364|nr:ATP synthase F0 subunit 8 [Coleonyx mitratus]WGC93721.1 ATP synthase F0 subunit 8 [Coleonyx mitratus]